MVNVMEAIGEKFPTEYVIHVIGEANDAFESSFFNLVKKHFSEIDENAISQRYSSNKKFLSLKTKVRVKNKTQLDQFYRELKKLPSVLFTL